MVTRCNFILNFESHLPHACFMCFYQLRAVGFPIFNNAETERKLDTRYLLIESGLHVKLRRAQISHVDNRVDSGSKTTLNCRFPTNSDTYHGDFSPWLEYKHKLNKFFLWLMIGKDYGLVYLEAIPMGFPVNSTTK